MTSRATIIGDVQRTSYSTLTIRSVRRATASGTSGSPVLGLQTYNNFSLTAAINTGGTATADGFAGNTIPFISLPAVATSVICGFEFHITASTNLQNATSDSGFIDGFQIFQRTVYRSLS
jgi:hypothetical protein